MLWEDGASPTDYTYTGQRSLSDIGLMDYNARFYDPMLGRFTSPDSIIPDPGSVIGYNRFAYVNNNPIIHTDPTGNCLQDACVIEIIGFGILIIGVVATVAILETNQELKEQVAEDFATNIDEYIEDTENDLAMLYTSTSMMSMLFQQLGRSISNYIILKAEDMNANEGEDYSNVNPKRRTEDQQALDDLAAEAVQRQKQGNPISEAEAEILDEWAEEYNVPQHHPAYEGSREHWKVGLDHTHIYNRHVENKYNSFYVGIQKNILQNFNLRRGSKKK